METLTIRSQLDHFRLIDAIRSVDDAAMSGIARFDLVQPFAGLEVMAQLAALHVRRSVDFRRHVFLLKVIQCRLPEAELAGRWLFEARRRSHSANALRYAVTAGNGQGRQFSSELLVGVQDYDERFQAENLKERYRQMFLRLCGQGRHTRIGSPLAEGKG